MTVTDICRLIRESADISPEYKEAILCGKASDTSIRDVGKVLDLRAEWEAFKAKLTLICDTRLALDNLSDADMAVHMVLSDRAENVMADEKIR